MVEHAATAGHAAGGNDDARRLDVVDGFGLVGSAREMEFVDVERVTLAAGFFSREFEVVILFVADVKIGGAESHGTIDINGKARNALLIFELAEVVHEGLRAADGESRNDDGAATLGYAVDDLSEKLGGIAGGVVTVAVSGFADENVGSDRRRGRILENRLAIAADITGEENDGFLSGFGDGEDETGRAEDVAGVVGVDVKLRADVEAAGARHELELLQDGLDLLGGIEGARIGVAGPVLALRAGSVFFLEVRGVLEKESGQLDGGLIGEDGAAVAVADEAGEPASVIEMRVREDGTVDGLGIDGKRLPVAILKIVGALEDAAIHEKALVGGFDEIFGTGDAACGA